MEEELIKCKFMHNTFEFDNIVSSFMDYFSKDDHPKNEIDEVFKSFTKRKAEYTSKDFIFVGSFCRHVKAYCLARKMEHTIDDLQSNGELLSYLQWYVKEESLESILKSIVWYIGRELYGYEYDPIIEALENFYFDIKWEQVEN